MTCSALATVLRNLEVFKTDVWGWTPQKRPQLETWCHPAEVVTEARGGNVQGSVGGRKKTLGPQCVYGGSWCLGLVPNCACQEATPLLMSLPRAPDLCSSSTLLLPPTASRSTL